MAKLIKDGEIHNIITDGDVVVTSPSKIGKTLNEVLDEQQSDINKLKSNVKYIYAYGGVGGSGSGGSGSGEKPVSVLVLLNGLEVRNGGDDIVLGGRGQYKLNIKINNGGEKTYYVGYSTVGAVTDNMMVYKINGDNRYSIGLDIELNGNGILNIGIVDSEGNSIGYYSQKYIVDSDTFNVSLNYIDENGIAREYSEPYECFIEDRYRKNRFLKIDYSIFLVNYTNVSLKCQIEGEIDPFYNEPVEGNGTIEIPLEGEQSKVTINGNPIFEDVNMGSYIMNITFSYIISGKPIVRTRSIKFSVIPSDLYINIRTIGNVLYDDIELLKKEQLAGTNKYINQGSSLMMYCKIFEGRIEGFAKTYSTIMKAYDAEIDDNGNINWKDINIEERETLTEQIESSRGVSVTFPTEGIKKIVFSTTHQKGDEINTPIEFVKYVYVKKFDSEIDWYDSEKFNPISERYFRANQGDDTYYLFPQFPSGNGVLSLTKSPNPTKISLESVNESDMCTVISFGIQISNINSENAKIADLYTKESSDKADYSLSINTLFDRKIAIPTEVLDKNDNSKYHLVQIIRSLSGKDNNNNNIYIDSLYIDGLLESSSSSTVNNESKVGKIVLQNINVCYNLISVQYFKTSCTSNITGTEHKFNPDGYAYQYWLSYKDKYVNSNLDGNRVTEDELFFYKNIDRISFDGTNVVVDEGVVMNIAHNSDLPTVIFSYDCKNYDDKPKISDFMELLWMGQGGGNTSFGKRKMELYWIPKRAIHPINGLDAWKVNIPEFTDNDKGGNVSGVWNFGLQGTSTMNNRIKNFSLSIETTCAADVNEKILFSPKFDIGDPKTFLPDVEWTIKADIADSAHANNTSIGKFVNDVCSKIDTNIPDINRDPDAKEFIKNTLEGIPVLMYFMCTGLEGENSTPTTKIYYFGVYNFNLGRSSYYNLGYNGGIVDTQDNTSDFMRVFKHIKNNDVTKYFRGDIFSFAVGQCILSPNITIGEIQENDPEFDFHQYRETLLFKNTNNNNNCMFGSPDKITGDFEKAKKTLCSLVLGVAKAGKYCFKEIGKEFVTSRYFDRDESGNPIRDENGNIIYGQTCVNRYLEKYVPNTNYQIIYNNNKLEWVTDTQCDTVNLIDLKKLIARFEDGNEINKPLLNYKSAAEYYTICMAFGMVDSVLKNMNLKNFRSLEEGPHFYCAFYDMDCALEEANDGIEKVSYLASTDYWYSPIDENTNEVYEIKQINDYWNSDIGTGFGFTSSYLFAVVKYARAIYDSLAENEKNEFGNSLDNYPQKFWANLRKKGGKLESADSFINNYFKSGIATANEYLASLNYRVKYLYYGKLYDSSGKYEVKYLANNIAFNGSRKIKVKNWLQKRLRFLDVMMNVNCLTIPISPNINVPMPVYQSENSSLKNELIQNNDITILHSAFDNDTDNKALSNFNGSVKISAPVYTPFIFTKGTSTAKIYLLTGGDSNLVEINTGESQVNRFYGSGLFTDVDKIESMLTTSYSIISDNLEKINYGKSTIKGNEGNGFNINTKSIVEINLDSPKFSGRLNINEDCISLEKINISGSGLYGNFDKFPNLKVINISGVNSSQIKVSNSKYLIGGDNTFKIRGIDENNKTKLSSLDITGVTGTFNLTNTEIEDISIENTTDRSSHFSISSDKVLKKLNLKGFKVVSITSCNNLEELNIDDALEELYINLSKLKGETESKLTQISFDTVSKVGIFNFTKYTNLRKVTLKNCDKLVHVKLPDYDIETDGMSNNENLKWIDTGELPAFRDTDNQGGDGYIDGVGDYADKKFPIYSIGSKLILCSFGAFNNCPRYAMRRSDSNMSQQMIGGDYIAYTNIIVSDKCESLENTFSVNTSNKDDEFDMDTAIRFIEKCVPDNVKQQINSLLGCFRGRTNVKYENADAAVEKSYENHEDDYILYHRHPILKKYTSLFNISEMYKNTGVSFVSKFLLDLPSECNNLGYGLKWDNFITGIGVGGNVNISDDALYNISYRLNSYSSNKFTIYEYINNNYQKAGTKNEPFKICDFFFPFESDIKEKTDGVYMFNFNEYIQPYTNITSINSLNFDNSQYLDFREMFYLFPNITNISSFLNGDLSKYNISGLLKPCKYITSITQSFCDSSRTVQKIDLYNFFNWDENTTLVEKLFEGSDDLTNGFAINKYIKYEDFQKVLQRITTYTKLDSLTNLFSYCTITNYQGEEISFGEDVVLNNIINISNLFDGCTSDYKPFEQNMDEYGKGLYKGGVLNIGRSFFKNLSAFTIAHRTLANTHLMSPLTYDYFCKRGDFVEREVLLFDRTSARLRECKYRSDIIILTECFSNTKFVNCKNWFVPPQGESALPRNHIIFDDNRIVDEFGFEYYIHNNISNSYDKYVLDNDIIDDCLYNYTDFVPKNLITHASGEDLITWYNHDLFQDFYYYGNIKRGEAPFDVENVGCNNTIQKTYCCLPPDFLYGCDSSVNINGIFANSNIIGVIPRNLTKKIKNQYIANIFKNVNIMPNLEYYYDRNGSLNGVLTEFEDFYIEDNGSDVGDINEYTVIFRDNSGKLIRRKPVNSDRNLGQFVYVPANFTTSVNISNTFNFRYNLPRHWEMPSKIKQEDGTTIDGYKSTKDLNDAIAEGKLNITDLSYHSQYYLTTDKSAKWEELINAKNVFIASEQDIDFSNENTFGKSRTFNDSKTGSEKTKNTWVICNSSITGNKNEWSKHIIGNFNIDLNLCGKKNPYNMLEDNGCPIVIKNRSVHLDYFVSGILTVFLNGRVFDSDFDVKYLTTSNHKSSGSANIINYFGLGKNIILPKLSGNPEKNFVLIPPSKNNNKCVYYDFMVDGDDTTKQNYEGYLDNIEFVTKYNKYIFK